MGVTESKSDPLLFHMKHSGVKLDSPLEARCIDNGEPSVLFTNKTILPADSVKFWILRSRYDTNFSLTFLKEDPRYINIIDWKKRTMPIIQLDAGQDTLITVIIENNTLIVQSGKIDLKYVPDTPCWIAFILDGEGTKIELLGSSSPLETSILRSYVIISPTFVPSPFSCSFHGECVVLSNEGTIAERREFISENQNYVYASNPFNFSKCLAIQLLGVNMCFLGSFSFGLKRERLFFVNKFHDENWVVKNIDIAGDCVENDVFYFWTDESGHMFIQKNAEEYKVLFDGVPQNEILWPVFDVYGRTTKISMWTCVKYKNNFGIYIPGSLPIHRYLET